jgi:hypothetical protein
MLVSHFFNIYVRRASLSRQISCILFPLRKVVNFSIRNVGGISRLPAVLSGVGDELKS